MTKVARYAKFTAKPGQTDKLVEVLLSAAATGLSPRELEVLRLVARGYSNAEIGGELFIAESTVKTHLLRVFGKLDVGDRTAAVITAMNQGLL